MNTVKIGAHCSIILKKFMKEETLNVAMILAGGAGVRMGADRPKQFLEVMGKPVIVYTIECFQAHPEIELIEVVCVKDYIEVLNNLIEEHGLSKVKMVVPGGDTYQDSVVNGLAALDGVCSPDDIILTHMAANPILTSEIISDSIEVAKAHNSAISRDVITLCVGERSTDDTYTEVGVDRDTICGLNTPQTLKYSFFKDLYARAEEQGVLQTTEPHITSLIYAMGERMYFSKGSPLNIKLTTKDDLEFFEAYLVAQERKRNGKKKIRW